MSHKLIALVVKADNETEAEHKAQNVIDNVICYQGDGTEEDCYNVNDYGKVVRNGNDFVRTAPINSEYGKEFIKSSYFVPGKEAFEHDIQCLSNELSKLDWPEKEFMKMHIVKLKMFADPEWNEFERSIRSTGYYVRDEQGQYITEEDSRLHDDSYFVVPVDIHS